MFKPHSRLWLYLLVFVLAAFALRIFKLESQSLWYDEAFSVWLARLDLGAITARTAADIQPPFYYYLLHFWMVLAGESEFAVRFFSLAFGVLTVPLLYTAAHRLFNRTTALVTALVALVSPLYLWYSQEARMYTLITFLCLLSSYALLRAMNDRTKRWWTVFALANIAAAYTHYFAFVVIAFQVLFLLWQLSTRHSSFSIRHSLLALAAIVVAFLPWVPFMLNRLGEDASYWRGPLKLDEAIRHIFINLTMGESVLEDTARVLAAGWLLALLVGLFAYVLIYNRNNYRGTENTEEKEDKRLSVLSASVVQSNPAGLGYAILYLIIPLALLLFLFYRNPKFNARYLMIASPGLFLLLGAALASLWALLRSRPLAGRVAAAALLVAGFSIVFGTSAYADKNTYFDPAFTKADFRGVAQYIQAHAYKDEAIVLTSGHLFPAFDYYYKDAALPELRLPDDPTLNAEHVLGYTAADELNRGVAGKRGVWLVQWQDEVVDPNGFVPLLLSSRGAEQPVTSTFWQVRLRHWALPADAHFSGQPEMAVKHPANFKNKIELLGLTPTPTPADQGASFNLYWQALDSLKDDYQVSLRIVDAQGNLWGKQDRRPAGYTYPTTRWNKGENLFGSYTVPLLPGTPAGDYFVTATLFTASDQTGLDVLSPNGAPVGRTVKLGPIKVLPAVKPPAVLDLKIQHSLTLHTGPLTLLGYNLKREQASTGESIPLTLFWRAEQPLTGDYRFQLAFGDKASAPLPLANESYLTSQWQPGEIVRGQYVIPVPADAATGPVNLQLKLIGPDPTTLDLTQSFTVVQTDRLFVAPQPAFAQEANFNNAVGLTGYNVNELQIRPGATMTVTLDWKALGKMDKPYTVFVHLLDKDSQSWGQKDAQPLNGTRATPTWVEGEYLVDTYSFQVKPDAPPGSYQLEIGWYDAADPTYARLQVIDANGNGAGDRVLLGQKITVAGGQ